MGQRLSKKLSVPEVLTLSSWGCFTTAALGSIGLFCPCICMCWCGAPIFLYQLLNFCLFCFLGSGVDHPPDCSSWLQRLGLAKSEVGRNSSSGPDKASSFHCPDAVNSAGGELLVFLVSLHLRLLSSLNWYKFWKGERGGQSVVLKGKMCSYVRVLNVEMKADLEWLMSWAFLEVDKDRSVKGPSSALVFAFSLVLCLPC